MRWIFRFILTLSVAAVSLSAFSLNLDFMQNTATIKFNDEDWKMFNAASTQALSLPNGHKVAWKNHNTGHAGFVEPLNSVKKHGMSCRKLRIVNRAHHAKDHYIFMFCKHKDGWKVVS